MSVEEFTESLAAEVPGSGLPAPLAALGLDAKGSWTQAHALVDELETREGMAVHAYLHRKEGAGWNADYWYRRAGSEFRRTKFEDEWTALVEGLLTRGER
jgi:hypothetical protein